MEEFELVDRDKAYKSEHAIILNMGDDPAQAGWKLVSISVHVAGSSDAESELKTITADEPMSADGALERAKEEGRRRGIYLMSIEDVPGTSEI